MQVFFMVLCGIVGGIGFIWLKIPGGAMVGAMAGTILYLIFLGPGEYVPAFPPLLQNVIYIAMGILIGSVFRPELFELFCYFYVDLTEWWFHWRYLAVQKWTADAYRGLSGFIAGRTQRCSGYCQSDGRRGPAGCTLPDGSPVYGTHFRALHW